VVATTWALLYNGTHRMTKEKVMNKWFCKELDGVNSDLKRHAEKKEQLESYIAESDDPVVIKSYKNLLALLEVSKANVANKIGRGRI
jgi:hypothetical protein